MSVRSIVLVPLECSWCLDILFTICFVFLPSLFLSYFLSLAVGPTASEASDRSDFSLGAVNDMKQDIEGYEGMDEMEDMEEVPRQEAGDEAISSRTKWHKHTVKVLTMLKRNMTSGGEEEAEGEGSVSKPRQLSYDELSKGCTRRTAAGVFFELLQLKTWDFIVRGIFLLQTNYIAPSLC